MTVISTDKDLDALTFTVTARFSAPVERVWQVWANPRLLERWWGPPTHPATVTEHSMAAGGLVRYYMTGPEGDRYPGLFRVVSAEPPHRFEFEDAFADEDGNVDESLPVSRSVVSLTTDGDGTTMVIRSVYPNREALEQVLAMGMEEGISQALGQVDALLAD